MKYDVQLFENEEVRSVEKNGEKWVSLTDVAKSIGYSNPARDSKAMLDRNPERFSGYSTKCAIHQVEGTRKVKRELIFLNLKGVIAFCSLSQLPNAIPFQRWADATLEKHIKETASRKQIYGAITDKTVEARNLETDEWHKHGAQTGADYGLLTKIEYDLLFGDKNKKKRDMTGEEILKLTISNLTNVYLLRKKSNPIGINGIEKTIQESKNYIDTIDKKELKK